MNTIHHAALNRAKLSGLKRLAKALGVLPSRADEWSQATWRAKVIAAIYGEERRLQRSNA